MKCLFRRKFIIDVKFQWTVIAYTFVISLVTSLAHVTMNRLEILVLSNLPVWIGPIAVDPRIIVWLLILIGYVGIFLTAILFSNRLAGPIYRLKRHMNELTEGKKVQPLRFRRNDYFVEVSETYNKLIDRVPPKSPPISPSGNERGFSLIEALIVLGISSILAVSAITIFSTGSANLISHKDDAVKVRQTLISARNLAVTRNQCARVYVVDYKRLMVKLYTMNDCEGALPPHDFEFEQSLSKDATLSHFDIGPQIIFRPSGSLSGDRPVDIKVSSQKGEVQRFRIYPAIGQVRDL